MRGTIGSFRASRARAHHAAVALLLAVLTLATLGAAAPAAPASTQPSSGPQPAAAEQPAASVGFSFKSDAYSVRDLTPAERPFYSPTVLSRVDRGTHDGSGVRMTRINGVLYDHPGAAANYGIWNLNSYRVTGDDFFLHRAEVQARRLVDIRDVADNGGWYYPNSYARDRHGVPGELVTPPWYSAMAQGLALTLFSRLSETTGDPTWTNAADHTFLSYLRPGPRSGPYTVNVDGNGYYWLQEWPWPNMTPDRTLNGHTFSTFGLYEYYRLTGDSRALALFRGAATTVAHYLPAFRQSGWISCYCLTHRGTNSKYHEIHVGQLLQLYTITGNVQFARDADLLESDYPRPAISGLIHVAPGTYTALRFHAGPAASRKLRVTSTTRFRVSLRIRIRGRKSLYFRISSGSLSGWYLPEIPGHVYRPGIVVSHGYDPDRLLTFAGGSYTGFKYSPSGSVTRRVTVQVAAGTTALAGSAAVASGYRAALCTDGPLAGSWVRLQKGVTLR